MAKSLSYLKKLFSNDPLRLAKVITPAEDKEIARGLIRQIEAALGDMPRDKVRSWVLASGELGATVRPLAEVDQDKVMYDWITKTIFYNPHQDELAACEEISHELPHHLLCHHRVAPIRRGIERFSDNRQTLQHRVSRIVQLYFFGKQAN